MSSCSPSDAAPGLYHASSAGKRGKNLIHTYSYPKAEVVRTQECLAMLGIPIMHQGHYLRCQMPRPWKSTRRENNTRDLGKETKDTVDTPRGARCHWCTSEDELSCKSRGSRQCQHTPADLIRDGQDTVDAF